MRVVVGTVWRFLCPSMTSDNCRGTHGYMAPEVIEKGQYDSSADWFSLGCMLMKLLNG